MGPRGIVCIFAKPPHPGRVKTRLATSIGDAQAAELARAFLQDTWTLASSLPRASAVIATTEEVGDHFGLQDPPRLWLQGDGDLGQRLARVMRRALAENDFAIAIGADTPGLPERLLLEASRALTTVDAVLGPTDDGGFYLLGMRRRPSGLLERPPWSEPTTFAATRAWLEEQGLAVRALEPWFDVDRPRDLERLQSAIANGTLHAPATARLLVTSPGTARCG